MANHKFHGKWRFFDVADREFPPNYPPDPDGEMDLKIEDDGQGNGKLGRGSKHKKEDDLTGDVTPTTIKIREQDPDGLIDLSYEGYLIPQKDPTDPKEKLVLVGTWKINHIAVEMRKKARFRNGQNDGTWVMTLP